MATIAVLISAASFCLSGYALWVVQFNHGRLKMTQPTLLCMTRELTALPKIFLRTLLYATGNKGTVVQSMLLRVHSPGGTHTFDFWGHTESGKLTLGSGLFVGSMGVACDHHFNPRRGQEGFLFAAGQYRIEILAVQVRWPQPKKLTELSFNVDEEQAAVLIQLNDAALFLTWNADTGVYEGKVERRPQLAGRIGASSEPANFSSFAS